MEDPTTSLDSLSAWLSAIATFAVENIGFTLFVIWAGSLFVSTEVAKPIMRRIFTKEEYPDPTDNPDYQLVMDTMCPMLGLLTGYWVFPGIMSTTQVSSVDAWTGIAVGGMTGWFTKKLYDLRKNKEFVRATKIIIRKVMRNLPFVRALFTEEDIKYIEEGTQRAGEGDMVTITPTMVEEDLARRGGEGQ